VLPVRSRPSRVGLGRVRSRDQAVELPGNVVDEIASETDRAVTKLYASSQLAASASSIAASVAKIFMFTVMWHSISYT